VVGNYVYSSGHNGILNVNSSDFSIVGNIVSDNGQAAIGGERSGIKLYATGGGTIQRGTVVGNHAYDTSTKQLYGVDFSADSGTTFTNVMASANNLVGNATAGFVQGNPQFQTNISLLNNQGYNTTIGAVNLARTTPTYGASVAIDASLGNEFDITATNGTAFTVANPTNATDGQRITITIRNTFGVLGAVTWDTLYKLAAWTSPANTFSRSIDFKYNGTNWVEVSRATVDVPN
jgi:hypothetical protein